MRGKRRGSHKSQAEPEAAARSRAEARDERASDDAASRLGACHRRIPPAVWGVLHRLIGAGFQAFLVGGSLRDALLGRDPQDWDVATDARPGDVQALFPATVPTGIEYGTVTVLAGGAEGRTHLNSTSRSGAARTPVEVTTFRRDLPYRDGRRPSGVRYGEKIEEDLARRDFTVNALAWSPDRRGGGDPARLVDPWDGAGDLRARLIRAVGEPGERFREDALRMLRAVRLAVQLGFTIEPETREAIGREGARVALLSAERVRDELLKILASPRPAEGLWMLYELGLLYVVLPELKGAERLPQAKAGAPHLLAHLVRTAAECPPDPVLRLTGLLHDVGKMATRALQPDGRVTFHGHERAGAQKAKQVARRLRLSREATARVASLTEMHMVSGDVTEKGVRRWLARYGEQWVRELLLLRRADHVASGHGPDNPWADRMDALLDRVVAEASALHVRDLAIDGHDVMERLGVAPGPVVGDALNWLLDRALDDPETNERETLLRLLGEYARARL